MVSTRTRRPAGPLAALVLAAVSAILLAGCGDSTARARAPLRRAGLPRGGEAVRLDPADFTTRIDNPYLPMAPGSRWVYRDVEGGEVHRVVITVTPQTKVIDGVTARVVHDIERRGTETIEDTLDWFAQDRAGNVWYLGEATQEYKNGRPVSTQGVLGGRGGRRPAGDRHARTSAAGAAVPPGIPQGHGRGRRRACSASTSRSRRPRATYTRALLTKEFTPLEPHAVEYKLYARRAWGSSSRSASRAMPPVRSCSAIEKGGG